MYKVLLVDDEPLILDGIEKIVNWEELGLEVAGKMLDGSEALREIERTNIHIVITDIKMPNVSGLELIRQAREKGIHAKFIILSGYNEFDYVKEAIKLGIENYLLKPINTEELYSTLVSTVEKIESELNQKANQKKDVNILMQNILCRWVTNHISLDEFWDKISLLGINLDYSEFIVSNVRLMKTSSGIAEFENDFPLMSFGIYNICDEIVRKDNSGICFCNLNGDVVIVFMKDRIEKAVLIQTLESCIKNIKQSLSLDVYVTIGDLQHRYEDVHISYARAIELQNQYLIMPNSIIDSETLHKFSVERQEAIEIDFQMIKNILIYKKKEDVADFVSRVFSRVRAPHTVSRPFIQNVAGEILFYIGSYIREYKKSSLARFNDLKVKYSNTLSVKSLEEVKDWIRQVLYASIDFLRAEDSNESPLTRRILDYIHLNYWKESLSIKELSLSFNINAAYLGQLFKKETGDMFSDYLNKVRIEKAKEFLSTTDLKVGKIAEKVGYTDSNYFFKAFKKVEGTTPSEYRDQQKQ